MTTPDRSRWARPRFIIGLSLSALTLGAMVGTGIEAKEKPSGCFSGTVGEYLTNESQMALNRPLKNDPMTVTGTVEAITLDKNKANTMGTDPSDLNFEAGLIEEHITKGRKPAVVHVGDVVSVCVYPRSGIVEPNYN